MIILPINVFSEYNETEHIPTRQASIEIFNRVLYHCCFRGEKIWGNKTKIKRLKFHNKHMNTLMVGGGDILASSLLYHFLF